jgi:hypothetical protein
MAIQGTVWDRIREYKLHPLNGADALKLGLEVLNYRCIHSLIEAARAAGASLHHLSLTLAYLGRSDLAPSSTPALRPLSSTGMPGLKSFSFHRIISRAPLRHDTNRTCIRETLAAYLGTSNPPSILLDVGLGGCLVSLQRVLDQSATSLKTIFLRGLIVDYTDLVGFLSLLPTPASELCLSRVSLRSGLWVEGWMR